MGSNGSDMTEKNVDITTKMPYTVDGPSGAIDRSSSSGVPGEIITAGSQHLHRKLRGREVQLIAVGGAIGTSLFVQMGAVLPKGGPAGLLIGFLSYGTIMLAVNECFAEMVCYMPIPLPFVRLAGQWVDEALSFAIGWNFFLTMALGIPFEIVALSVLLDYWTNAIPVAAVVAVVTVIYAFLNIFTVRFFGVSEFYLSIFKVLLMSGLILFTFVTMVGGNPQHDAYGFRYWKDPGAFVSYLAPGNLGRFLGVLSCMIQGSFTMVGPEFIAMTAGEAQQPRKIMRKAYSSFVWRLLLFFISGSLCVGIVIPYNDQTLAGTIAGTRPGSGTGAASPYVIAMGRLNISGLPDLVNALIMTSVLSAGDYLVFAAARTLHGMALEGNAPNVFSRCTKAGVPWVAVVAALCFCLLAFLQVAHASAVVLGWLVDFITACYLLNYLGTCITYLHFYAALRAQGVDRNTLPYKGKFQPYTAWFAVFGTCIMTFILGFSLFINGHWNLTSFFLNYVMVGFVIIAFVVWKVLKRTKYVKPGTADLGLGGIKREIDLYEEMFVPPKRGKVSNWFNRLFE